MENEVYNDLIARYKMIKTLAAVWMKEQPECFDTDEKIEKLDYDARLLTIRYGDPDEEEEPKTLLVVRLEVKDGNETVNTFVGDKKFYMNLPIEEQLRKTAETLVMLSESYITEFPDNKLFWDWLGD